MPPSGGEAQLSQIARDEVAVNGSPAIAASCRSQQHGDAPDDGQSTTRRAIIVRVIDRNTPSDPRLQERRGDLLGRNALLFATALLLILAVGAFVLLGGMPGGEARATPTVRVSPRSTATAVSASPSARPSATAARSAAPTVAPSITTSAVGTPAQLVIGGQPMGTVVAGTPDYRRKLNGTRAPEGQRWVVVPVTYTAKVGFEYRAADWLVVDSAGTRHGWALVDADPALGAGSVDAGAIVTGNVTFRVPVDADVAAVVLRSATGADLMVFRVR